MKKPIKLVFGQVNRSTEFRMKEGIRSALITFYLAPSFVHVLCSERSTVWIWGWRVWRPVL